MKALASAVLCAFLAIATPAPAAQSDSVVELWAAKTDARVYALGSVTPPRSNQTVIVRFLRDAGSGYVLVRASTVNLSEARDEDGDGARESHFTATFRRPRTGQCKLVSVYRGDSRTAGDKETEIFPCAIPDFPVGSATITSDTGLVEIGIQIAETPEQQGYGLMYRRWLATDKGMAFLFPSDTSSSFYMQNTLVPLSIAFFDQNGVILRILDMEPCDDGPCPLYNPEVTYRNALEVNQGAFTSWGVSEGDVITITR